MKTFGIYKNGMGLDAIGARTANEALKKYAKKNGLTSRQMKDIWAEDLEA